MQRKQKLADRTVCFSREILQKLLELWRRCSSPTVKHRSRLVAYQIELLEDRTYLSAAFPEFVDPHPDSSNGFGDSIIPLSTGNVVVTSPNDDAGGNNAGAVYLFNGTTGELISTLLGSTYNDRIGGGYDGNGGVTALPDGNYLIRSPDWDNGSEDDAGAVTFGNGTTGVSGVISASNSLIGSSRNDAVGSEGVTVLSNGNYLVHSPSWDNGETWDVGALTFGDGTNGVIGVISSANSLIGSTIGDKVGAAIYNGNNTYISSVYELSTGNYLVRIPTWDNGAAWDAGAVTFGNGATGVSGMISGANSLIGATSRDKIGSSNSDYEAGLIELTNGNYVVRSPDWNVWYNGNITDAGAVTFGSGTTGVTGVVSYLNSLVGTSISDRVGSGGVTSLANGNYVVTTAYWNHGGLTDAGAVTFGDGTIGVSGEITSSNSLVGATAYEYVGLNGVTPLTYGSYVVSSPYWDNGAATHAGAVTVGNGDTGVTGYITLANSLVGSSRNDYVGSENISAYELNHGNSSVTALSNGNYVVRSLYWDNGSTANAGAVTLGSGTSGTVGVVSSSNSLVGSSTNDYVGEYEVTELTNGNYVVRSPYWDKGTIADAGAVTFVNGITGLYGEISEYNSLVGSSYTDRVGNVGYDPSVSGITALSNGNYVVSSPSWDFSVLAPDAGAVTFGDGTSGVKGVISSSNSLIGSSYHDNVGYGDVVGYDGLDSGINGVTALSNGNYVVRSPSWDNGFITDAGAVTFGNGTTGVTGIVTDVNSLVGSTIGDSVGFDYHEMGYYDTVFPAVTVLSNGNYVVRSPFWDNGIEADAGAVTFGNGVSGVAGVVSASNSLVGSTANDRVGGHDDNDIPFVTALSNGNYLVSTPAWDDGSITDVGAVTFGSGSTGVSGVISEINSLVGSSFDDQIGYVDPYSYILDHEGLSLVELSSGNYVVRSPSWDNGTVDSPGALTFGDGTTGVSGYLTAPTSVSSIWDYQDKKPVPDIILNDFNNTFLIRYDAPGRIIIASQTDGFPPSTLAPLSNVSISENASAQILNLNGIAASGFITNPLRVTAMSSNTNLIPDPVVSYTSPEDTGSLTFTPVQFQSGTVTITVTVEDGGLDSDLNTTEDNSTFQRSFEVTVIPRIVNPLADFDIRVVNSPTDVQTNGEVSVLPENQAWVEEWSTFWLEVWVDTNSASGQGFFAANIDLNYQTNYTTATDIEYGSGFSQNQMGTIDDSIGMIQSLYAETNQINLDNTDYLLLARIKFEALSDDHVDLDTINQLIGPYDLGFTVSTPQEPVDPDNEVSVNFNPFPGTSIWANPYDLNDDDKINYRDLISLVGVYGIIPSESDSDYAWAADLDQNDRVNYRDLISFVGNYGKSKTNDSDVNYPGNYPDVWENSLVVASPTSSQISVDQLTQSLAEGMLEKALTSVSPSLSSSEYSKIENVSVQVVDLANGTLGRATSGTIYLDVNAAGYSWFVDKSPSDHSEFAFDSRLSLIALPDSEAAGHIDLWTVILHELGHLAGKEHKTTGLMEETLAPGVRKLADWNEDSDLFFASVQEEAELLPF